MEWHPSLHLNVVAIVKGAFRSPLTTVTNFTFYFLYMIKISGKVDKPTLTMDSAIWIFCSLLKKELLQNEWGFFSKVQQLRNYLNCWTLAKNPLFHSFLSSCHIYQILSPFIYIYIYIYILRWQFRKSDWHVFLGVENH